MPAIEPYFNYYSRILYAGAAECPACKKQVHMNVEVLSRSHDGSPTFADLREGACACGNILRLPLEKAKLNARI